MALAEVAHPGRAGTRRTQGAVERRIALVTRHQIVERLADHGSPGDAPPAGKAIERHDLRLSKLDDRPDHERDDIAVPRVMT